MLPAVRAGGEHATVYGLSEASGGWALGGFLRLGVQVCLIGVAAFAVSMPASVVPPNYTSLGAFGGGHRQCNGFRIFGTVPSRREGGMASTRQQSPLLYCMCHTQGGFGAVAKTPGHK